MVKAKQNKRALAGIIRREMENCVGLPGGALSRARKALKDAYYGEPYAVDAARREAGWSTYVDRSVMETVEWAKGPLLKVFAGTDDLVRFEPASADEAQYAQDATDYVNKVVFGDHAFDLVYGPLSDGLYQRVGWAKVHFASRENRFVVRELTGLDEVEAVALDAGLAAFPQAELELARDKDSGRLTAKVWWTEQEERICVTPLPSERVIIAGDAMNIETARFIAHWEDRMAGELLAEGHSKDLVESLPSDRDSYPEGRALRAVNSEHAGNEADDRKDGARLIRVYEAYVTADLEGDGSLQRLKVLYAGNADACTILDVEEWTMQRPPLFAACSLPLQYSPVGLCLGDLVLDQQELRTELFRNILDNVYLSNHGEIVINRENAQAQVNMDQFLARRPGGVYETTGNASITPLPVVNVATPALAALELTDRAKEQRTGIGMTSQGLSADVLQNTATGAAILEEQQNSRLEAIARIYAETFYKPMARYILALANKYLRKPVLFNRKGRFDEIRPSLWNPEMAVSVAVGLGTGSRRKKAAAVAGIMDAQKHIIATLGKQSFVRLSHVQRALHKYAESLGFEYPEQFFGTAEDAGQAEQAIMQQARQQQQQQQQQPNPEMLKMQMQKAQGDQKMRLEREKAQAHVQNEAAKIQAGMTLRAAELEQKGMLSRRQMELEAELDAIRLATSLPGQGATEIKAPEGQGL